MQYFKRLIQKILEVHQTHELNQRDFPDKLLQASMFARVILKHDKGKTIDYEHIEKLHKIIIAWYAIPRKVTTKQIKETNYKETADYKKAKTQQYKQARALIKPELQKLLEEEIKIINEFLHTYRDVRIEEEPPKILSNIPGVIGIIHPHLTYEKQARRR